MSFLRFVFTVGIIGIIILGCACSSKRKEKERKFTGENIYLDYRAWGDEETGLVTVRLQYRRGGPEADPMLLEPPSKVEWDGIVLKADSSRMNGVYYEKTAPISNFGKHTITFFSKAGKKYETLIDFPIMSLRKELPGKVDRNDLIIEIEGLKDGQDLQVLLSDTSFYGRGVDRIYTVKEGMLTIGQAYMARLRKGPIYLEIIRDESRILEQTPEGGGLLSLNYAIKREFQLVDSLGQLRIKN